MRHAGASRESPHESTWETLSQIDSVGRFQYYCWQLFCYGGMKFFYCLKSCGAHRLNEEKDDLFYVKAEPQIFSLVQSGFSVDHQNLRFFNLVTKCRKMLAFLELLVVSFKVNYCLHGWLKNFLWFVKPIDHTEQNIGCFSDRHFQRKATLLSKGGNEFRMSLECSWLKSASQSGGAGNSGWCCSSLFSPSLWGSSCTTLDSICTSSLWEFLWTGE